MKIFSPWSAVFLAIAACFPDLVFAETAQDAINQVSGNLQVIAGGESGAVAKFIAQKFINPAKPVAVLVTIIAGAEMALSQDDQYAQRGRLAFIGAVIGVILLFLAEPFHNAVIVNSNVIEDPTGTAEALSVEFYGVVNYISMTIGTIAVLMIIISGIRAVINLGSGEGLTQLRRTVFAVIGGVTIIAFRTAIVGPIAVTGDPGSFLTIIVDLFRKGLSYLGIIAVAMLILAGFYMIINIGNDEQYTKARTMILRVAIGIFVILSSLAIINAVFNAAAS